MNLNIARNRAKYFDKKMIIEYRLANGSIYKGDLKYSEANSLSEFNQKMSEAGFILSYAKVYEIL